MESFNDIWTSSAGNYWSWVYVAVILTGVVAIVFVTFQKRFAGGPLVLLLIVAMTILSVWTSTKSINEKWRIRGEWVTINRDELSPEQHQIATTDGANLVLGPWLYGFIAFMVFVCAGIGGWLLDDRLNFAANNSTVTLANHKT